MAAAADYNRALAYAPNDPRCSGSSRACSAPRRARGSSVASPRSSSAPLVLGAGRVLRREGAEGRTSRSRASRTRPVASAGASPSERRLPARAEPRRPFAPSPVRAAAPRGDAHRRRSPAGGREREAATRVVTFSSLQPQYGVHMAIDGLGAADPHSTSRSRSTRRRTRSSSPASATSCIPKTMTIPPGDKERAARGRAHDRAGEALRRGRSEPLLRHRPSSRTSPCRRAAKSRSR